MYWSDTNQRAGPGNPEAPVHPDLVETISMRTKGPLLTLLAVVVLALVLLTVNLTKRDESASATAGSSTTAPAAPAPAQAAPPAPAQAPAQAPAPADAGTPIPAQAKYTGKTAGRAAGEASVAVAVTGGKASAYLCDGKKLESWLKGDVHGSSVTLTGKNGTLTGTYANGKLSGNVTVDGLSWAFSAAPSKSPAGVYRARKGTADAGWIVYPDGTQTGVQNIGGTASPAPALDPASGSAVLGGDTVPVQSIEGGDPAVG